MVSEVESRVDELSDVELEALHEVELGVERLHRANGHLVAFHHNTGRAMDHLAVAEDLLRECGRDELADELRDRHLPQGVIPSDGGDDPDAGRWSYDVLECFQDGFLADVMAFDEAVHDQVTGGLRHAHERAQEREWKRRARRD